MGKNIAPANDANHAMARVHHDEKLAYPLTHGQQHRMVESWISGKTAVFMAVPAKKAEESILSF